MTNCAKMIKQLKMLLILLVSHYMSKTCLLTSVDLCRVTSVVTRAGDLLDSVWRKDIATVTPSGTVWSTPNTSSSTSTIDNTSDMTAKLCMRLEQQAATTIHTTNAIKSRLTLTDNKNIKVKQKFDVERSSCMYNSSALATNRVCIGRRYKIRLLLSLAVLLRK